MLLKWREKSQLQVVVTANIQNSYIFLAITCERWEKLIQVPSCGLPLSGFSLKGQKAPVFVLTVLEMKKVEGVLIDRGRWGIYIQFFVLITLSVCVIQVVMLTLTLLFESSDSHVNLNLASRILSG